MSEKIKILLVDDHKVVREGLKRMLEEQADFIIAGEAQNGKEALEYLKKEAIDIVITDLKMPEMSGIELTEKIKNYFPDIKVLVLSMFDDEEFVRSIIQVEAEGYLLKSADEREIVRAVRHVANSGTYYAREILVIMANLNDKKTNASEEQQLIQSLSNRELEVLKLICQELSSKDIAEKLFLSKDTVDGHRKRILKKLAIKNSISLIRFALRNNII